MVDAISEMIIPHPIAAGETKERIFGRFFMISSILVQVSHSVGIVGPPKRDPPMKLFHIHATTDITIERTIIFPRIFQNCHSVRNFPFENVV